MLRPVMDKILKEFREKKVSKRGVKPKERYLENSVNRLERHYIEYFKMDKIKLKKDPETGKPERDPRIKKRNEISALESRVQKRISDLKNE